MSNTRRAVLLGLPAVIAVLATVLRPGDDEENEATATQAAQTTARFRVRSSKADEVHVHGYDLSEPVAPGKTNSFDFKANTEGIFEIELESSGAEIASLKVEPK